jgi:hypothetical protein
MKKFRPSKKQILGSVLALVIVALFASAFAGTEMSDDTQEFIIHTK